eukprot:13137623-Ditylum_brightwellii.AAC.1
MTRENGVSVTRQSKGCHKLISDLKNKAWNVSCPRHARRSNNRLHLCCHRAVSSELPVKSR